MKLLPAILLRQGLFDSVTKETNRRIANAHAAVVFNIPDRFPLSSVQATILNGCYMTQHPCPCSRLPKNPPKIIAQFYPDYAINYLLRCLHPARQPFPKPCLLKISRFSPTNLPSVGIILVHRCPPLLLKLVRLRLYGAPFL